MTAFLKLLKMELACGLIEVVLLSKNAFEGATICGRKQ